MTTKGVTIRKTYDIGGLYVASHKPENGTVTISDHIRNDFEVDFEQALTLAEVLKEIVEENKHLVKLKDEPKVNDKKAGW